MLYTPTLKQHASVPAVLRPCNNELKVQVLRPSTTLGTQDDRSTSEAMRGYTLIEMMIALAVLLTVSAIVMSLLFSMSMAQGSISNRTEMHSSVRSVTEVMQQEVSQAGRVALPTDTGAASLAAAVTSANIGTLLAIGVNEIVSGASSGSTTGMFVGERLLIGPDAGDASCTPAIPANNVTNEEIVEVTAITSTQITGMFQFCHASGAGIRTTGGFATGILPASTSSSTAGTPSVLKMYGDINSDGKMVYIEYSCDPKDPTSGSGTGNLTRTSVDALTGTVAQKTANTQILLSNLYTKDPGDLSATVVPCFNYQVQTPGVVGSAEATTLNVSITMTARTPFQDPQTSKYQYETKALLNISPRNTFEIWEMESMHSLSQHIQPAPPNVTNVLQ